MDEENLLRNAEEAIKNGDISKAKQLLTLVLTDNPRNTGAILLMTETINDQREKIDYVKRTTRSDPVSQRIVLAELEPKLWRSMDLNQLAAETQKAMLAGDKDTAKRVVNFVLQEHPDNERAWLILADLSDDPQAKRACFERVLEINPKSKQARNGIKALNRAASWFHSQQSAHVFFVLVAIVIGASLLIQSGILSPANTAEKEDQAQTILVGDEATLVTSSGNSIMVTDDKESYEKIISAAAIKDEEGFGDALLSGNVRYLPSGLRVRVIEYGGLLSDLLKVRVIDQNSEFYNQKAWCLELNLKPVAK